MKKQIVRCVTLVLLVAMLLSVLSGCAASHTHAFGEWTIVDEATCTQEGKMISSCSCGEDKVQTMAMLSSCWTMRPELLSPLTPPIRFLSFW